MNTKKIDIIIWILVSAVLSAVICAFRPSAFILIPATGTFFAVRSFKESGFRLLAIIVASFAVFATNTVLSSFSADAVFTAVSDFALTVLAGSVIGLSEKRKKDFPFVLAVGSLAYLSVFIFEFSKMRFFYKLDVADVLVNQPIKEIFTTYGDIISKSGIENADKIADAMAQIQWYFQQAMAAIIPSILIILCAVMALAVFLISRKWLCARGSINMSEYPRFCEIALPKSSSLVLAVLYGVSLFAGNSSFSAALTNILLVISASYVACGLSVIDFFLSKKRVSWILRLIIYAIGIPVFGIFGTIIPIANVFTLLMLLGVIDGLLDFRRLRFGGEKK